MKNHLETAPLPLIAVVDDDNSLRISATMLVRSFGFRAEAFASAKEVLTWPHLDEVSCLILDVCMPVMTGLELQRQLRRTHPRLPIIFITAYAKEEEERQAMNAGAITMLRKPVADGILLDALRRAVASAGLGMSEATPEF